MRTVYASMLTILLCSACASGAAEQDSDLVADQFVDLRAGIECADAAKDNKRVQSLSLMMDCLSIGNADEVLRSGDFNNPESLRLFAWLAWDNAASFAQCFENKARSEAGFLSGKSDALGRSLNAARKACADHPLSLQSMAGETLDLSDPTTKAKMLARSLSRLSIHAALSQADACPAPKPACLPAPPPANPKSEEARVQNPAPPPSQGAVRQGINND